jgi:hypothetical protein
MYQRLVQRRTNRLPRPTQCASFLESLRHRTRPHFLTRVCYSDTTRLIYANQETVL